MNAIYYTTQQEREDAAREMGSVVRTQLPAIIIGLNADNTANLCVFVDGAEQTNRKTNVTQGTAEGQYAPIT